MVRSKGSVVWFFKFGLALVVGKSPKRPDACFQVT